MIELIIRAPMQAIVTRGVGLSLVRRIASTGSRVVAISNVSAPDPTEGELNYQIPGNPLFAEV